MSWQIVRADTVPARIENEHLAETLDRVTHWDEVYRTRSADAVSWFQPRPEMSLKLIRRTGVAHDAAVIDIGGGASSLAANLLEAGFIDLSVLDIAARALAQARAALGARASSIEWINADITAWAPARRYQLWHDRSVLHFLTDGADQAAYVAAMRAALAPGGWAIIGGFAPGGPTHCSGLDVVQHDGESLARLLGPGFSLMEIHGEIHLTPMAREQRFRTHVFERTEA